MMNIPRRDLLRAMATGLPLGLLRAPASYAVPACAPRRPQFLIVSTSGAGDPVNANAPGSYEVAEVTHAADPMAAPVPIRLGGRDVRGARAWTQLPDWVLARTAFVHHATLTNNHADHQKTLTLMGATNRQEQITSICARALAPCLGTLQTEPLAAGAGDAFTFNHRPLPNLRPSVMKDMLGGLAPARIVALRDSTLDRVDRILREQGTPAQRRLVDQLASTRQQARRISEGVLSAVDDIKGDDVQSQLRAAVALVRMRASPVIGVRIPFGGDNHTDPGLMQSEVPELVSGVQWIAFLMEELRAAGLQDDVTFVMNQVFGRTLRGKATGGRDHWSNHNVAVLIGPAVRPGVAGGMRLGARDVDATGIDSATGAAAPGGGDVPFSDTLLALGRTIAAAAGVPDDAAGQEVPKAKVLRSVVA